MHGSPTARYTHTSHVVGHCDPDWNGRPDNHTISLQHRQTFCSRVKHLVLLCLGADISLLSISPHFASDKSNSKLKKESLRVTMVHGDVVVLSGSKSEARNHIYHI
jgi:hypothetical protein